MTPKTGRNESKAAHPRNPCQAKIQHPRTAKKRQGSMWQKRGLEAWHNPPQSISKPSLARQGPSLPVQATHSNTSATKPLHRLFTLNRPAPCRCRPSPASELGARARWRNRADQTPSAGGRPRGRRGSSAWAWASWSGAETQGSRGDETRSRGDEAGVKKP